MDFKPMEKIREFGKHPARAIKPKNIDKIPRDIKILTLVYLVYTLGTKSVQFFIPIYVENILGNVSLAGVVVSVYGIAMILLDIPIGDLLDRIGRRSLILIGMAIRAVSGMIFFLSTGLYHLFLARLVDGTGISFSWDSVWTTIRDRSPENLESESMAFFQTGTIISAIIGPIIGGYIAMQIGLRKAFLSLIILSTIAVILGFKWVHESLNKEEGFEEGIKDVVEKDKVFKRSITDLKNLGKKSLIPLILIFLYSMCLSNIWFIVPLFSKSLGSNLFETGLLLGLMYSPALLKYWFSEFSDKMGDKKVIFYLSMIGSVTIIPLIFISDKWILLAVVVPFFGILQGLSPSVNALLTKTTPGDEMGELTGLFQNFKHLGMFFGPFIAGFMADYFWISAPFAISTVSLLLIATITFLSGFNM